MAIIKKEAILSPTSEGTIDEYLGFMSFYINYYQEKSSNLKDGGGYVDLWTIDVYDGKTKRLIRLFSEGVAGINNMPLTTFPASSFKGKNYPETKSTMVVLTEEQSKGNESYLIN